MTKRNKFYQIGFFTLAIAFIALCLFVGITAIQKQMKLNLAVKMNPSIVCEIYASMNGENGTYNKIFSNVEGSTSIGENWLISGNTLTYDNSSTDMGLTAYIKVTNKTTGTRIMVESGGASKGVVETNGTTSPFAISIPAKGSVQMLFSQVFKVTTTLTNASVTATTNLYEIGGTYYAKTGTTPTMTLTSDTHYTNPPSSVEVTGATKGYTNGVLTLSNITGDVTVTASASAATYTVSSRLSGISSNTIANEATYNTDYTFTLTVASASWTMGAVTYTVGGGSAQTPSGTTTDNLTYTYTIPGNEITGAIVINATATSSYSIYATINGEDVLIGEYSQKSTEQPITINYPSTFTYTGDLMSAVTGVSEVTATQITIAANTTGPITIVPKGYTMGTYVDTDGTIFTEGANTVEYEAFAGYKYLQFNHTNSNTYSKRWIIIGGGKSETTTYGTGATVNADSLESNQLLLLSEKLIETQYYDKNVYTSFKNYYDDMRGLYYQSDVRYLCRTYTKEEGSNDNLDMSAYTSRMAQKRIQTSWNYTSVNCNETYNDNGNGNVNTTDYMFLLAYDVNSSSYARYAEQEFLITNYLGSSSSDARRICYNSSNSASYWWLRSGLYNNRSNAYRVDGVGGVGGSTVYSTTCSVRPSFILNLA